MKSKAWWLRTWVLLLLGCMAWAFFPTLFSDFVVYDDADYVTDNLHIQNGWSWEVIRWAMGSVYAANWHPLTWFSHLCDYNLYGLWAGGHHLTNVLFHCTNTVLLFLVLKQMTGAAGRSLAVAALFGLHPTHVESVAWIAERKDVLSGFFWMLVMWCYVRWLKGSSLSAQPAEDQKPGARATGFYFLALLAFALGLMSKQMLVTLPFVLLLLDFWPLQRFSLPCSGTHFLRLVVEKIPFFVLAVCASAVTFLAQDGSGATSGMQLPLAGRLQNAAISYCRYLGDFVYPRDLAVFYPHPQWWPLTWVCLAVVFLAAVSLAVTLAWRRWPYLAVGWFWYLGTLVPVIGLVQVGVQSMADRYSYLTSIGISVIAVWGVYDLTRRWHYQRIVLGGLAAAVFLTCTVLTRRQVAVWKNSETLFRHALAVTRNNWMAHLNLAVALGQMQRYEEEVDQYKAALRLRPDYVGTRLNLGMALQEVGRYDEAVDQYLQAVREMPDLVFRQLRAGNARGVNGRVDSDEIGLFFSIRELTPKNAQAHLLVGLSLRLLGRSQEAIEPLESAVALAPEWVEPRFLLGLENARLGRYAQAAAQYQKCVELKPDYAEAQCNLGTALARLGRLDEAAQAFRRAIELNPQFAEAYENFGWVLTNQGKLEEAIASYQSALKIQPERAGAQRSLEAVRKRLKAKSPG